VSSRTTTNRLQSGLCTVPQGTKLVSAGAVLGLTRSCPLPLLFKGAW